jgi:thiamine biosynthesis lipoprotein ApbE
LPALARSLRLSLPLLAAATAAAAALPAPAAVPLHRFHSPRAIGTTLDVLVATDNPAAAESAYAAVTAEISRLEAMLSTRIPASSISHINQTNDPVVVPAEVLELLTTYQSASALTGGLISPLTGELSARWSAAARQNILPTDHELSAITTRIGQTTLAIDPVASTVQRIGPATLNIDALGKPFILQKATRYAWSNSNLTGLLVNIGGDIMTCGGAWASRPWSVQVANPSNPADNAAPLGTLTMTRSSVATSGDYARPRTIASRSVSHILNPLTGQPAAHSLAATVLHNDPILANALATAFCITGPSASHLAEQLGADFLLASPHGVQISEKLPFSADAAAPAAGGDWPKDFKATIPVTVIAPANTARPDKAAVAVWIEDDKGQHVKTLADFEKDHFGHDALKTWSALGIAGTKTAATKNAGTYTLDWDGTDQAGKPVPQGTYTVHIELAYRYNGHSITKTTITCGADKSTADITKNGSIDASTVTYGPPAKPAP